MMDPKVLLMPVYSRGNEIERLRGALSLACFFNAHLDVLHAQAKPSDFLGSELFGLSANVRRQVVSIMNEGAVAEQENLQSHFNSLCADYLVEISDVPMGERPTACWREIDGARSELVALQGRVSDLVIIPHSKSGEATLTFEEAIFHTGRPVLLVPRGMWDFKLNSVLIAWDGGPEVAKAVQQALPFLKRAQSVVLAISDDMSNTQPSAERLSNYLTFHHVGTDIRLLDEKAHSTGEALLAMATDLGSDLLVTGGYAHTRLRQRILGGVTHHMLKHAEVPVLMAH